MVMRAVDNSIRTLNGCIFNIQRYSLHDGPGIRTIVFLKGCPLRCPWCANPESQNVSPEMMGSEMVGKVVTVDDVIRVVEKDSVFYKRSGGGMTLSGGEPLMQPEFSTALMTVAKEHGFNTAIETSGFQKWNLMAPVIEKTDVVFFDIKMMNSSRHEEVVGAPNELILANAEKIAKSGRRIIIRLPLIPGYNDGCNLDETAAFAKEIGASELHLLPYHRLGVSKYTKLGRTYSLNDVVAPEKEQVEAEAKRLKERFSFEVLVS